MSQDDFETHKRSLIQVIFLYVFNSQDVFRPWIDLQRIWQSDSQAIFLLYSPAKMKQTSKFDRRRLIWFMIWLNKKLLIFMNQK